MPLTTVGPLTALPRSDTAVELKLRLASAPLSKLEPGVKGSNKGGSALLQSCSCAIPVTAGCSQARTRLDDSLHGGSSVCQKQCATLVLCVPVDSHLARSSVAKDHYVCRCRAFGRERIDTSAETLRSADSLRGRFLERPALLLPSSSRNDGDMVKAVACPTTVHLPRSTQPRLPNSCFRGTTAAHELRRHLAGCCRMLEDHGLLLCEGLMLGLDSVLA